MNRRFKQRICRGCGQRYLPAGSRGNRCAFCRKPAKAEPAGYRGPPTGTRWSVEINGKDCVRYVV